ncbi:unnamed protein product [Ilex paraguariensis]|uniref:ArsA/GET3 Anion-transporting ATPase-like domain-containing protein n=1 Tax=Ilex paraguariensis TaxID=185542 RepID=A0ABC8SL87_9AQUA
MASSTSSVLPPLSSSLWKNPNFSELLIVRPTKRPTRRSRALTTAASPQIDVPSTSQRPTKLVTFLGKGGSGKTTSAIFAAHHYAMAGLKTCLVIHSQDPTAEYLLNCRIGTSPITCSSNLSVVRLETTQMLLEPLNRLKQADARLNMTQGVLEGVVGEELGVLPGMDSIFSILALERLVGFFGNVTQRKNQKDKFDIVIYDGLNTEETIRMIGANSKARLYLKYLRKLAERTDLGRLAGPSLLRLVDEAMSLTGRGSHLNGKMSAEIWDYLEQTLERGSSVLAEPHRFGCYVVMDPNSPTSLSSALRYWGCAIQAGAQVSGAFCVTSNSFAESLEEVKKNFSPLPFASIPHISMHTPPDWNEIILNNLFQGAQDLLTFSTGDNSSIPCTVMFDPANKSVTLLMPGFDKSEIKLYQVWLLPFTSFLCSESISQGVKTREFIP